MGLGAIYNDYYKNGGGNVPNAVTYTPQNLTENQQIQVKENLGFLLDTSLIEKIPNWKKQLQKKIQF